MSGKRREELTDGCMIAEALEHLEAEGYRGQFSARAGGMVMCLTCRRETPARDVPLAQLLRTEGVSDPDDETAIAALTCPRCGTRGTVGLTYGPEAPPDDAEVLGLLKDVRA